VNSRRRAKQETASPLKPTSEEARMHVIRMLTQQHGIQRHQECPAESCDQRPYRKAGGELKSIY